MQSQGASPLSPRTERALAALAIVTGLLLRLLPALDSSYWYDEIFTVAISSRSWGEIAAITRADVHPPLYYWMVHALMLAGRALGGAFVSLAWLRLASLLPGMAICLIGWRLARRHWGAGAGLVALAALALSPPLAFFSVELRNYAFATAALLAAFACLLRAVEADPRRAWLWAVSYGVCASAALYSANLSAIHLVGHAAIFLSALARPTAPRRRLLGCGFLAAGLVATIYAPWIPATLEQNARLQAMDLPWMPVARWRDLASTLFFYLPCGPLERIDPFKGGFLVATLAGLAGFSAVAMRLLMQRMKPLAAGESVSNFCLLAIALALAVPLGIAFIDSRMGLAKIFLPTRYNMMAAPYSALLAAWMAASLKPRRFAIAASAILLAWGLGWSVHGQALRAAQRDDRLPLSAVLAPFGYDPARDALAWTDPDLARWLPLRDGSPKVLPESLRAPLPGSPSHVWFVSHLSAWLNEAATRDEARALECALASLAATRENLDKNGWMWDGVWSVPADRLPEVMRLSDAALESLGRERAEFKGAQLLLPIDRNFHLNPGFTRPQAMDDGRVFAWTRGDSQVIQWVGPARPGVYRIRASFWRPQPFPEPEQAISYDFSGEGEWQSAPAPVGSVVIEGRVEISRPRQPLLAGFQIPSWIPQERIPGSIDDRPLGIQLLRIELWPEGTSASGG